MVISNKVFERRNTGISIFLADARYSIGVQNRRVSIAARAVPPLPPLSSVHEQEFQGPRAFQLTNH